MDANPHVVTVVIPTLGRGSLARTLEALTRQSRSARPWAYLRCQYTRGIGITSLYLDQKRSRAPVNWGAFERRRHYMLCWLGQKAQGLGFLWGLTRRRTLHFRPGPDAS